MKKLITLLLALVMVLSLCPAMAEEPVVLTVAIADKTNVEDYNTNEMTLYIEKALNVDLQFNVYAAVDYNNKINLMVTSGDKLEDIILCGSAFPDALVYSWAQAGALAPLTEYYQSAETAPTIFESIERTGYDFRGDITLPDGEIYYIPIYNQSYGNEYQKIWYYDGWMQALGADIPTTIDELADLLRQVIATDLNGNDVADEIGMAGWDGIRGAWFSYLMNAFTYYDAGNDHLKVVDGVVSFAYTEEAFRDGVEYIAAMIEEGLIAPESVTQDQTSWKNMINTADHTVFSHAYTTPSQILSTEIKNNHLVLGPVEGPDGHISAQFQPSKANCGMVISATCENVDAAFAVGDFLCSELLGITTRWGQEGRDWDYVAKTADPSIYEGAYENFGAYIIVYDDATFWSSGGLQNRSWMQNGPYVRQYGLAAGRSGMAGNISIYEKHIADADILYQTCGLQPEEVIAKLIYSAEEQEIVNKVSPDLKTFVEETVAGWLLDGSTLTDEAWDAFLAGVEELGAADWLEVAQAAYDRSR